MQDDVGSIIGRRILPCTSTTSGHCLERIVHLLHGFEEFRIMGDVGCTLQRSTNTVTGANSPRCRTIAGPTLTCITSRSSSRKSESSQFGLRVERHRSPNRRR